MYRSSYRRRTDWASVLTGIAVVITLIVVPAGAMCMIFGIVHAWWPFVPTMPFKYALGISIISTASALIVRLITGSIFDRR